MIIVVHIIMFIGIFEMMIQFHNYVTSIGLYPSVSDPHAALVDYKYTLEPYKHMKPSICMKLIGEDVYLNICNMMYNK